VGTVNEASYVASIRDMRAEPRLYLRMNLWVEWREHGDTLSAQGYTVDISPKGCLAIVPQGLAVGQKLVVQNELNGKSAEATLIWRGHERPKGWELGLELEDGAGDFWGVAF
jgi:hypothetical protein